jgi:hypothetical protein
MAHAVWEIVADADATPIVVCRSFAAEEAATV